MRCASGNAPRLPDSSRATAAGTSLGYFRPRAERRNRPRLGTAHGSRSREDLAQITISRRSRSRADRARTWLVPRRRAAVGQRVVLTIEKVASHLEGRGSANSRRNSPTNSPRRRAALCARRARSARDCENGRARRPQRCTTHRRPHLPQQQHALRS